MSYYVLTEHLPSFEQSQILGIIKEIGLETVRKNSPVVFYSYSSLDLLIVILWNLVTKFSRLKPSLSSRLEIDQLIDTLSLFELNFPRSFEDACQLRLTDLDCFIIYLQNIKIFAWFNAKI